MNRSGSKLIIPFVLLVAILVGFFCLVYFAYFMSSRDVISRNERNHKYRFSRVNPRTEEVHTGITTLPPSTSGRLKPYEYISGQENEEDYYFLISNFGETEFGCTGNCFCSEEEDEYYRRRRVSGVLSKSTFHLLTAVSLLAAFTQAEKFFETECTHLMNSQCSSQDNVRSEIEECHEITNEDSSFGRDSQKNKLIIHGNVRNVLNGKVDEKNAKMVKSSDLKFGLGAGTGEGLEDFGEAIMYDDKFYVKVANEEKDYVTKKFDDGIRTSFLAALSRDAKPSYTFTVDIHVTMQDLYEYLLIEIHDYEGKEVDNIVGDSGLIAIYGTGVFACVESTAIKTAPIFGEVLRENPEKYFHDRVKKVDVEGTFFGVISLTTTDFANFHKDILFTNLFYKNFADAGGGTSGEDRGVISHTHIAFEDGPDEHLDVHHLLTQSVIKEAKIDIYPIHEIATA